MKAYSANKRVIAAHVRKRKLLIAEYIKWTPFALSRNDRIKHCTCTIKSVNSRRANFVLHIIYYFTMILKNK